jgi:hypothetical protein
MVVPGMGRSGRARWVPLDWPAGQAGRMHRGAWRGCKQRFEEDSAPYWGVQWLLTESAGVAVFLQGAARSIRTTAVPCSN